MLIKVWIETLFFGTVKLVSSFKIETKCGQYSFKDILDQQQSVCIFVIITFDIAFKWSNIAFLHETKINLIKHMICFKSNWMLDLLLMDIGFYMIKPYGK